MTTVLIVEDNPDTQLLYNYTLRDEKNYQVVFASGGLKAIDWLIQNSEPALIIADLHMPGMSGRNFITQLKLMPKFANYKVLIVSGADDIRETANDVGASGYLQKPLDLQTFYTEVERIITS